MFVYLHCSLIFPLLSSKLSTGAQQISEKFWYFFELTFTFFFETLCLIIDCSLNYTFNSIQFILRSQKLQLYEHRIYICNRLLLVTLFIRVPVSIGL